MKGNEQLIRYEDCENYILHIESGNGYIYIYIYIYIKIGRICIGYNYLLYNII